MYWTICVWLFICRRHTGITSAIRKSVYRQKNHFTTSPLLSEYKIVKYLKLSFITIAYENDRILVSQRTISALLVLLCLNFVNVIRIAVVSGGPAIIQINKKNVFLLDSRSNNVRWKYFRIWHKTQNKRYLLWAHCSTHLYLNWLY